MCFPIELKLNRFDQNDIPQKKNVHAQRKRMKQAALQILDRVGRTALGCLALFISLGILYKVPHIKRLFSARPIQVPKPQPPSASKEEGKDTPQKTDAVANKELLRKEEVAQKEVAKEEPAAKDTLEASSIERSKKLAEFLRSGGDAIIREELNEALKRDATDEEVSEKIDALALELDQCFNKAKLWDTLPNDAPHTRLFGESAEAEVLEVNGVRTSLILIPLAIGGHNEVFCAYQMETGELVIVRRMKDEFLGSEPHIKAWEKEVVSHQMLEEKKVPNIVKLLGVFSHDVEREGTKTAARRGMILERCGGDLAELTRCRPAPEKARPLIVKQLMSTLKAMHELGYIHGDLKSDNVLYIENEEAIEIKLADWGEFKRFEEKIDIGGTPLSQPPEAYFAKKRRSDQKRYATAIDCWAAGLICYRLKYGKPKALEDYIEKTVDPRLDKVIELEKLEARGDKSTYEEKEKAFLGQLKVDYLELWNEFSEKETPGFEGFYNFVVEKAFIPGIEKILTPAIGKLKKSSDSHDKIIVELLEFDPEKRATAETILEKFRTFLDQDLTSS